LTKPRSADILLIMLIISRRMVRVYLTQAGLEKELSLNAQLGNMQELIFKDIREAERALLRQWLVRIIQNIAEAR
jgi:DNA-binding MarR family transcriptional regulator